MITQIYNPNGKDAGIVYNNTLSIVEDLLEEYDIETAFEYLVACVQYSLYGEHYSDNPIVKFGVKSIAPDLDKNNVRYYARRNGKIEKYRLNEIANLYNQEYTQNQIAEKLGLKQQDVSYRINNMIQVDYPDLLLPKIPKIQNPTKNTKNTKQVNVNVNDTVTVTGNVNGTVTVTDNNNIDNKIGDSPNDGSAKTPPSTAVTKDTTQLFDSTSIEEANKIYIQMRENNASPEEIKAFLDKYNYLFLPKRGE